jgi:hypothetical protein
LFHFSLDPSGDSWALYFFPYFFMGILVHKALCPPLAGRTGSLSVFAGACRAL